MENFILHNKPLIKSDSVEIISNYRVLHFDDFPILYLGTNKFGNKIIGSHLEEDDDNKCIYTLHTILTNREFYDFLNYKVSYLDILKKSNSISLVEKDFNFITKKAYDFDFDSIPADYLPLENSYCPSTVKAHSLMFSISLKGKLADINKAIADEVSKIQNGFTEFLEERIKALKGLYVSPKALLQPYSEGSFKINFELELNQKGGKADLFLQLAPIDKYIANYIQYISNNFSEDKEVFKTDNAEFSEKLKNLGNILNDVYDKAGVKKPDNINQLLKDDIFKSVNKFEKITEQVGENFESVEILNVNPNEEIPLAFIDREFSESFQYTIEEVEISKKGVTIDETYKDYKIYIYHLNTDSRTGNALIKNVDNEEEMSKPKIKINSDQGLEQTKYTESLYLNKWITVKAKAKKIGEKFKYLGIEYE